jgi:hypothetical protein
MWKRRVIVAAIGEKGVRYGNARSMPRIFLVLVEACRAEFYDLHSGGCVLAYAASSRSFRLMEQFISYAEAAREILPELGIGITECRVPVRYRLSDFKPRFHVDQEIQERALSGIQGSQTYRDDFKRLQIASYEGS